MLRSVPARGGETGSAADIHAKAHFAGCVSPHVKVGADVIIAHHKPACAVVCVCVARVLTWLAPHAGACGLCAVSVHLSMPVLVSEPVEPLAEFTEEGDLIWNDDLVKKN